MVCDFGLILGVSRSWNFFGPWMEEQPTKTRRYRGRTIGLIGLIGPSDPEKFLDEGASARRAVELIQRELEECGTVSSVDRILHLPRHLLPAFDGAGSSRLLHG